MIGEVAGGDEVGVVTGMLGVMTLMAISQWSRHASSWLSHGGCHGQRPAQPCEDQGGMAKVEEVGGQHQSHHHQPRGPSSSSYLA